MTASTGPLEGEVLDRRPEPVLDAARVTGLLLALVLAVLGLVRLVLDDQAHDLTAVELAVNGVLTAAGALLAYLLPIWQARKARAKVTPLDDPRGSDGGQLAPATQVVELTGVDYVAEPQVDGIADHAAQED